MPTFTDKIAQYIFEKQIPLKHLTVVLPSQRARKYLQRSLFKAFQKPIISPRIITMNSWIQELSPLPIIEQTRAVFKLYDIHLKVDKEEPQTMDEFLEWGRILLSDFDEIDRYLIDSKNLFRDLTNIKEIENWSFNSEEELTEGQKRYLRFWNLLHEYYSQFNLQLEKEGEIYMGKAYKYVANHIDSVFQEDKNRHFIFAGFNALSAAEVSIIKQLYNLGKADVFIDADKFYLEDTNHEAGSFIRHFLKELKTKSLPFVTDNLKTTAKEFHIINCTQPTGQAKVSATILNTDIPQNELSETLLLLADESLVVPVIKNIPRNSGEANITLGLPLKNTSIKSWVELLFSVQEHFRHFKSNQYYHKDLIRFLKHPFIIGFCNADEQLEVAKIEQDILKNNWTFIFSDYLKVSEELSQLLKLFFTRWNIENQKFPISEIQKLNQILFSRLDSEKHTIERAIIHQFDKSLTKLNSALEEFKPVINLSTFKSLFNQHWTNDSVAYYGNALKGLQVMGLLETRLLDFKNVIVVGLNDGKMPPTNPIQSMIMMDLRRYHQLPTPRDKQGLFAHHFYRLLHTAEKVWITYSSSNREGSGMDEPSRYILQLELELARQNPLIKWKKQDYTLSSAEENIQEVRVEKNQAVLERMDEYFSHRTSASALNVALRCPLDFYYKYLLGFGEEEKVEEEIEANTFGAFIHETLQYLYQPFSKFDEKGNVNPQQRLIKTADINEMLRSHAEITKNQFYSFFHYSKNQKIEGKNFLSLEIAQHLTAQFLEQEKNSLMENNGDIQIIGLEMELFKSIEMNINGEKKSIRFKGFIDRIDKFEGETRILDYKSGKCSESDVKIYTRKKDLSEVELVEVLLQKLKTSKYLLQLLIYLLLFHEKFGYYPQKVGVISLINLRESPFYLDNQLTETTEGLMEIFLIALEKIIGDLYDTSTDFEHDLSSLYCGYC